MMRCVAKSDGKDEKHDVEEMMEERSDNKLVAAGKIGKRTAIEEDRI